MNPLKLDRRKFIKGSAAMATLASVGMPSMAFSSKDKKYKVGLIGTGWYGKSDLFRLIQVADVDVIGIADPDAHLMDEAGELISQRQKSGKVPKKYKHYRQMLDENKLDIVLVGSPDHWHALQAIDAIHSGANVYLQKPISVDVMEGEAILAAARKHNKVVQIGTQRRSTPHLVDAKNNIIDKGLLGKISHVEMCCFYHMRANGSPEIQPVPDFFDYELWVGPGPMRPFDGLPHRRWWRTMMEYSNGITGDMCVHMFDAVRWTLGLGWPKSVFATGGIYVQKGGKSTIADTQTATFHYDDLDCVWNHRSWGTPQDPEYPWAYKIYGDKGTLKASVMKYEFIPQGKGEAITGDVVFEREKYPEDLTEKDIELQAAPATRAHMKNFIQAIEKGGRPVADIEEGHISTASCIMANMSMKLGRPLAYDPEKRIIINDEEATRLLTRPYRAPFIHPDPNEV